MSPAPEAPVERLSPDGEGEEGSGAAVPSRAWGVGLVALGLVGLVSALVITVDKIKLLQDPSFKPACDLNPVVSCGSVMQSDQAAAFGFPNPIIGLVGFSVVVTLGVLLAARVPLPRWVLVGLALGASLGLGFVHWLAFQSLFRINALCPWCLAVWAVTFPIWLWSALIALRASTAGPVLRGVWSVRYLLVAFWYLAVAMVILVRFWDYWRTLV